MIVVSIGFDGKTIADGINIKQAFNSTGGYYYSGNLSPNKMISMVMGEVRSLENKNISKSISLAKGSTTPENAAKKIRNVISDYKKCLDLYMERNERFKSGKEDIREIIRSYFYSEQGRDGYLPVKPVAICSQHSWNNLKKLNLPSLKGFNSIPRVVSINIGKDMEIGGARLFTFEVTLGQANGGSSIQEEFEEVSKHKISLALERTDD